MKQQGCTRISFGCAVDVKYNTNGGLNETNLFHRRNKKIGTRRH